MNANDEISGKRCFVISDHPAIKPLNGDKIALLWYPTAIGFVDELHGRVVIRPGSFIVPEGDGFRVMQPYAYVYMKSGIMFCTDAEVEEWLKANEVT